MKPEHYERRQKHSLDQEFQGLAARSLRERIPVDQSKLRKTDAGRVIELRRGAKEKLLAMAGHTTKQAEATLISVALKDKPKLKLSFEQADKWFSQFKERFENDPHKLHEGIKWEDIEKSLLAQPAAVASLYHLDENGHEVNVLGEDSRGFIIGTASKEAASGHRNIVFDRNAQDLLALKYPEERCNGNAIDIASALGVDLMERELFNDLRKKLEINTQTWDWLKTDAATREKGLALNGDVKSVHVDVADNHLDSGSWRASLRVSRLSL